MKSKVKIGLVGCGRWGKYILNDLLKLNCEVWVAERNAANRTSALEAGAKEVVSSQEKLPLDLNGYVVAVQTNYHFQVISELLQHGKPIFSEKPLTPSLDDAKKLYKQGSDHIFVMHKWRYHSAVEKMGEIIRKGEYGKVKSVDLKRKQWKCPHDDVDAIWILLPHDLSILFHLLEYMPKPTWATCTKSGDDWMHSLYAHFGEAPKCSIEISECFPVNDRSVHVLLENASLLMNDSYADHIIAREGNWKEKNPIKKIPVSTEFPLYRELSSFIDYILGGAAPMSSMADELKIIGAIEDVRKLALRNH
jgi:predicted dehydrogenase